MHGRLVTFSVSSRPIPLVTARDKGWISTRRTAIATADFFASSTSFTPCASSSENTFVWDVHSQAVAVNGAALIQSDHIVFDVEAVKHTYKRGFELTQPRVWTFARA